MICDCATQNLGLSQYIGGILIDRGFCSLMITNAPKMGIQWGYIVGYKDIGNAISLSQVSHGTNRRV